MIKTNEEPPAMSASTVLAAQQPSTNKPTGPALVTAPTYNVSIGYLRDLSPCS